MKAAIRKTTNQKNNVLSLVDDVRFKTKQANDHLFSHTVVRDRFQFQAGDQVICRAYLGEELTPDTVIIAETETGGRILTTVSNASKIRAIVVAYRREVFNG